MESVDMRKMELIDYIEEAERSCSEMMEIIEKTEYFPNSLGTKLEAAGSAARSVSDEISRIQNRKKLIWGFISYDKNDKATVGVVFANDIREAQTMLQQLGYDQLSVTYIDPCRDVRPIYIQTDHTEDD